ncbi:fructose-1,6-bisphosphatase, class II [Candidatus Pelagibacter sp. HTCC7211]|uniref:class II fructose-bisphosphatase n=1 Tax=Pelagibacter sp. (strain HTCC7211) TaxID=439493 RepID=UPI000183BA8E|nr:class II fructose-bisphosphatase [Candidatus Pelagibacter sp. HTCC7211]EDZ60031.1 fructose-1,6-bisphosphatase, class II [Candidatus Pelagibacter sp. HTCC7211]
MTLDKKFVDQFVNVTVKAANAASYLVGKKDKNAADQAAVDSMRSELNKIDMIGKVVIGEGSLDEAPMLYTGEILGNKRGPTLDIAVDPVEGTNFVANNLPGGIAVLAIAEKNNLFNAPETYMSKIATGKIDKSLIDLDFTIEKNIKNLSDFKNKEISSITACILDRPRHKKIIDQLKDLNVKIKLISDGDVLGALFVSDPKYEVDIFLGIGGGPEGVLAASALDAYDCHFQGRFIFDNDQDIKDAKKMGIYDLNKKYELNEIVKGDSIFCATGITDSKILKGIKLNDNRIESETLVTHKSSNFKKIIKKTNLINE